MTDKYDFIKHNKENTFFNHLLLESELTELIDSSNFDSSNLEIKLEINGITVKVEDFNKVLIDWGDRVEKQIKDKVEYLSKEKSVIDNAKILLKEKLGIAYEILYEIENSEWKLDN